MIKNTVTKESGPAFKNTKKNSGKILTWAVLVSIVFFTVLIRIRLLDIPLERDEGEYAYCALLLMKGIPPFAGAYIIKLPGIIYIYAFFMLIFGKTVSGIHSGLLLVNAATTVLMFFLGRRLIDDATGLAAAASFAVMSLSQWIFGFSANTEPFMILFVTAGTFLLLRLVEDKRPRLFFFCGLMFGLAFLVKQTAFYFIVFAIMYLAYEFYKNSERDKKRFVKELSLFTSGLILPFIIVSAVILKAGVFDKMWFFCFDYILKYSSEVPFQTGIKFFTSTMTRILSSSAFFWLFASAGLFSFLWDNEARKIAFFSFSFFIFSFLSVSAGLYFREHYFILLIPAISLSAGIFVSSVSRLLYKHINKTVNTIVIFILIAVSISFFAYKERSYLFTKNIDEVVRGIYGQNPFLESIEIAKYLKDHTTEDEKIAVVGSEPQIYFYANRQAATKYIITYFLMDEHEYALTMQNEFITQIEEARPKYLVYVKVPISWLIKPGSKKILFRWLDDYISENYERIGVVDIRYPKSSEYRWDKDSFWYTPDSVNWIYVFKRK